MKYRGRKGQGVSYGRSLYFVSVITSFQVSCHNALFIRKFGRLCYQESRRQTSISQFPSQQFISAFSQVTSSQLG